ncbi:MAG: TolC family protein [Desulfobacterales bacterium]|jgi:outer membrane protein TolC|nr:TolC family protein [Desulfobacterales bacterium]
MMKRWILLLLWVGFLFPPAAVAYQGGEKAVGDLSGIQTLDLLTAKQIALSGNPTVAAAQARVQQAAQRVRQASAAYWPQVDTSTSVFHSRLSDNEVNSSLQLARLFDTSVRLDNPDEQYSAGISASWVLFDGFARKFSIEAETLGELQQVKAGQEVSRQLLAAVAATYYNAQLFRENMAIAAADKAFNQRQVVEAETRLRVGTGALSDVLNFKVQANSARSRWNTAQLEYDRFLIGLVALMGFSEVEVPKGMMLSPLAPECDSEMQLPEPDALVAEALVNRPDLQQSDFRIQQSEAQIQLARADLFPKLNFSTELSGNRTNDPGYEGDDFGYALGLNLSYNLFSGGATQARVREALWVRTEAAQNRSDLSLSIAAEVRKAVAELRRAQAEIKLQRVNTELVQQNRDLVEQEYAAGQGTLVRLNEAQRDLITAKSRLALALVSLRQAWQNLESATGRILRD